MSFVPGSKAIELLRDLQRNESAIQPYPNQKIAEILSEVQMYVHELNNAALLYSQAARQQQARTSVTEGSVDAPEPDVFVFNANIVANDAAIRFHKRCMLALLDARCRRTLNFRWQTGRALPDSIRSALSSEELDFFREYSTIVADYMTATGLDLTLDSQPPRDVLISVRVGDEDCGELITDTGTVQLRPHSVVRVRRQFVEHLILQGKLKQVSL